MVHSHLFADEKALFPGNGREKTFISSSASNISIVDTGQLTLDSEKGDRSGQVPLFHHLPALLTLIRANSLRIRRLQFRWQFCSSLSNLL